MTKNSVSVHPVQKLLDDALSQKEIKDKIADFQQKTSGCDKWMMFSDYCLDDKSKANDVMTFVLMPYLSEEKYLEMQEKIHSLQKVDIKNTSFVNKAFLSYLKSESVLIFSFVLTDRKRLFASGHTQCVQIVKNTLTRIRDCFENWKKTAVNHTILKYYDEAAKNVNKSLAKLNGKNPNIKMLNDILITALLGAYVSAKVLENLPIQVFGWFSDRDKVISGNDNIIMPIFTYFQFHFLGCRQFKPCASTPDDKIKPFFDDFNRIADVVTGAISDYNMEKDSITADKFNTVLENFLANNSQVSIFRLWQQDSTNHLETIKLYRKSWIARQWLRLSSKIRHLISKLKKK